MAYLPKFDFEKLVKIWRKLGCDYLMPDKSDKWLMEHFLPARFIQDISSAVYNLKCRIEELEEERGELLNEVIF